MHSTPDWPWFINGALVGGFVVLIGCLIRGLIHNLNKKDKK
jgi:hypothetical protein